MRGDISRPDTLSGLQLEAYHRDGFLLVSGLFDRNEAARLRGEAHAVLTRLAAHHDTDGTWSDSAGTETASSLQHCHDLQLHSSEFGRCLFDERLTSAFAQLMGTANVQLHHNKMFVKPGGNGSAFPFHQDWPFFPHAADSPTAAIIHLDDAPHERGCLQVIPGSHRAGRRVHHCPPHWRLQEDPPSPAVVVEAEAGDVLFFSCLLVHGSGPNRSDVDRTTWLVQVRDPADSPTVDRHRSPGQGTMLIGVNEVRPPAPSSFE